MQTKRKPEVEESALELKYCERCGGLWLRPVGGGQIYCATCSRAMAELPPSSTEVKRARIPGGERLEVAEKFEGYKIGEIDLDEVGGVA